MCNGRKVRTKGDRESRI